MFIDFIVACLCSHNTFNHVARHGVKEESKHSCKKHYEDGLNDDPFVLMPQYVADGLEWGQEPEEGGIRSTASKKHVSCKHWGQ